ncbi:hypothetical protein E5P55_00335 [Candidatus Pinguicoccus supinus]|uniref:5'-3' exonuclease alpha-helical arch N-terminal domain-containing protein n=1 Tax=Candidatus Pinguicoccus supinus TaxID=2529394 RepID=A0A7T0FYA2_9BACT|nr:hypothetical protein E5P55_00335 [Candidatus Pinguicoccus supinus]
MILFLEGTSSYRKKIYPPYKKHRLSLNLSFISTLPLLNKLSIYTGMYVVKPLVLNVEADDTIHSFLKIVHVNFKNMIIILSSDKDFIPYLNKNVFIYNNGLRSYKYYQYKFSLSNIKLFKHVLKIIGDSVDNIRGVSSIGICSLINNSKFIGSNKAFFTFLSYKKKYFFKKFMHSLNLNFKLILLKNYLKLI